MQWVGRPRTGDRAAEAVCRALLLLIAATGSMLFAAEAVAIAANPVFQLKIALLVLALAMSS